MPCRPVSSGLESSAEFSVVFSSPTPARLARRIEDAGTEPERPALPPIRHRAEERRAPLSYQQEQVWFHSKLAPESIAYQTQTTIRVVGALDLDVLRRALGEIVRRHEILRTTYREVDGRPEQVVHEHEEVEVAEVDLRPHPADERAAHRPHTRRFL